jgi:hypothetical protein
MTGGKTWKSTTMDTEKNAIPLIPEKIDSRTWRFQKNLDKGEYGFLSPVHSENDWTQLALDSIYTFGVD